VRVSVTIDLLQINSTRNRSLNRTEHIIVAGITRKGAHTQAHTHRHTHAHTHAHTYTQAHTHIHIYTQAPVGVES
jgi:hypothetical protein